ncbi:small glutamine-rich tetratricopeptide repeat-containing protein beta-like [Mya arenaria]|uniref:small glutamine-rich tetratricopeptide repeat-containing protein beta-like n=1 Tax=Mya arenaria TaxID=6604 RepID=UPI0022DFF9FC|nr:small glutamine-rich tetratricopeptide repeat-containing protein beta-like [Mya arenaria]
MADVKKLVFSIIRFLQDQRTSNTLEEEQAESLEVAIQCLESSYGIDTSDEQTVAKYQVQKNLLDLFNAQLSIETDAEFSELSLHEASPEEKEQAEVLKNQGNDFMKAEQFSDAIECYSQALKLDNKNSVYYCNRAAAYSKICKHKQAIEDCQKALMIDPLYSKAYGRMGIAYTALDDHESAYECYRKALELDPGNQSYQNNLEIAEQKLQESAANSGFNMGLGGGMPGIGNLLNNPGMMQMAQQMMTNPDMQNMMANMMQGMGQGGGSGGDFSSIMQMGQQLAQQMQSQNPELVNQLREQMGRPPNPPGNDQDPNNDQQPPPPADGQA